MAACVSAFAQPAEMARMIAGAKQKLAAQQSWI
jgi:hypothetical protein